MNVTETKIKDIFILEPRIFIDARGWFMESFNQNNFAQIFIRRGLETPQFVQDNHSVSHKGVLRGLHYQSEPYAQGKLIRVLQGSVLDVVVDIRLSSLTYGQHFKIKLDSIDFKMLYVPEGFAHGFATLEDNTVFSYKCTNFYNRDSEDCIYWNDPDLKIDWSINEPILSEKDQHGKKFSSFVSKF